MRNLLILISFFIMGIVNAIVIKPEMGLGIRGNGEFVAAHWGGLARLVEEYGAFGTVAGGSSASITIFLYESSLLNPHVTCNEKELAENPNCEKERLSFLIKSYEGIIDALPETKNIADLRSIYAGTIGLKEKLKQLSCRPSRESFAQIENFATEIQSLVEQAKSNAKNPLLIEIPNWELLKTIKNESEGLFSTPSIGQVRKVKELLGQLKKSYDVFGKFDAKNDDALFVRPGLINFKNLGSLAGRVANLLAGRGLELEPQLNLKVKLYLQECSKNSIGKEWEAISKNLVENKSCGQILHDLVLQYDELLMANKEKIALRENDLPGETISSFSPILSTAVVDDKDTIESWQKAQTNFMKGLDQGQWNWKPQFKNVKFGYWVKKSSQDQVRENLKKICEKEKDFTSCKGVIIGNHSWKTILALSPAEPGLARIQHFDEVLKHDPTATEKLKLLSLGGWSDLMPQKVLKAAGSKSQTLMTRRGYQTYFGQGVMMRLGVDDLTHDELVYLHQKDGAKLLSDESFQHAPSIYPSNPKMRTTGDWARGHNLHNPNSSFNQALFQAAAVLCTHWDGGDLADWKTLIKDSYNSVFYVKDKDLFPAPKTDSFQTVKEGETPKDLTKESGARYLDIGKEGITPDHAWFNKGCTAILKYFKDLPVHQSPFHPVGEGLKSASFDEEV